MKRIYLNSYIKILSNNDMDTMTSIAHPNAYIIQVELVGCYYIIETCDKADVLDLVPVQQAGAIQNHVEVSEDVSAKINEYRAIVLNNDPFMKYSGKTLGEIIDANDQKWVDACLKNMKNTFIKDKIKFLIENKPDDGLPF